MSETKNQDSTYEIQSHTVAEMKDLLIEMKGKNEDKKWQEKAEELEKELKSLKKNKNYGLFWKEKPEEFEKKTKDSFPILEEIPELAIKQDETLDNIIIEGDNYHTLSVLSYTHRGQVDVIYIDPPYNTGNKDFVYNDRYVDKEDDFRHSKWLSFMEKRLKLAKDLLKETGVIFISIDDNEQAQLKLLCDLVFGEENFVDCISWEKKSSAKWVPPKNMIVNIHEYILVYQKSDNFSFIGEPRDINWFTNPDNDLRWPWRNTNIKSTVKSSENAFSIFDPETGNEFTDVWAFSVPELQRLIDEKYLIFPKNKNWQVRKKEFFHEFKNQNIPIKSSWWLFDNQSNTEMLKSILWDTLFLNPKPVKLIEYILQVATRPDSLILDFFAWSGTTGHAVLALNKEDGGNRRFILCSNRENTSEFPDRNICRDITYERVKRVATGYTNTKSEQVAGLGGNIRYLRTDFIPKHKGTDNIRNRMVERCSEMLCLRENIWEGVEKLNAPEMRFYQRGDKYLAILFGLFRFEEFCQVLRTFDKPVAIYVFSRGQMTRDDFEGMIVPYTVEEIPDPILAVYKTIFWL